MIKIIITSEVLLTREEELKHTGQRTVVTKSYYTTKKVVRIFGLKIFQKSEDDKIPIYH